MNGLDIGIKTKSNNPDIETLEQEARQLHARNERLEAELKEARAQIAALRDRIAELERWK